ncbi:MAG: radical SAM protein, partial [Deltaproteobacteria bacterium]|nr:radical SAM protein [Deltaproteobacteria bacterium]
MHTVVLPVVRGAAPPRRLAPARAGLGCDQPPTYLRAIVTARCPLSCTYCHMEGDPAGATAQGGLPREELVQLLRVGVESGVRKLKLLGGDPLARADLPEIVQAVRATSADLDISVITAGVFRPERVDALYAAGLSRCNVSIHGWT